ncbi:hypothetical protein PFLUV_G00150310 [Perca fluviatilis]|uniref:Leishmanolysin-like peptidase n=1 Tax=Perca fluviatilis TaxID=8168 RepID=A0A6A5ELD1_PERFL|nr:hypothetical protein PFLUV_G00150310 [Perca fluviatilis]
METRLSGGGKPSVSRFLGPVLVFSVLAVSVSCHGPCKHRVPPPEEVVHHVHLKPERLTKRSFPDNLQLKIKIIYDYSVDQLPADKRRLVKDKLFPPAIDYLQRAFSVRRRVGPVLLSRPIAGYANLCPAMISSQPQEFEGMLSTVKHEIIHALGFSAGLFAFYHDDDGNPLTPRFASGLPAFNETLGLYQWSEAVIRPVVRLWDIRGGLMVRHQVHVLVTPRVVDEARRHFNCPILEGMELENQGGTGTELNHWEKRLLENEAMTGSHTQNRVFSRLTLAIMEDSGWYRANYSLAQRLDWGRGLGCDFVMKSCKFWMDRQRQRRHSVTPYCDTVRASPLQLTCRQDQLAVAVCNLQKYQQELPLQYQYFDSVPGVSSDQLAMFGGAVEIADFCPFSQEFSWHLSGEYQRNSYCREAHNQPDWWRNYGAEQYGPTGGGTTEPRYGPDSVCLHQKSAFVMEQCTRKMTYPDWGSGCYKVWCSAGGLTVFVQDRSFLCVRTGQQLRVSVRVSDWVYNGVLVCPACSDFCDDCPPPHQLLPGNATRSSPIDPCSSSPGLAITLWLLLLNLLPLVAGLLLCHCS